MKKITTQKLVLAGLLTTSIVLAGCYAKEQFAGSASPSNASLEKFTASVRKLDGQAESHYKMALYFQKNRRHKLALEELKRAVESNPGMAKAHNAMGVSYDNLRQYDDAIRCYHAALKIDPELDYAHNNLGYSQLLRGNNEKAIKAFKHAIRLNGENKRYRNNLALAYVMDEQYELATEQFKIIDNESDSEQKLAKLIYDLGKVKFRQFLKKPSEDPDLSGTAIAEKKPAEPVVVRKKIESPIEKAQADTPVPAAEESSVDKPVDAESADAPLPGVPPVTEESSEESETVMTASVVPAGDDAGQNIHTTQWVSWQESETLPAEGPSAEQPSDFPTNPLHVSAVRIAAGKVGEPAAVEPVRPIVSSNETAAQARPTAVKATPQPKIVEVSQVEKYIPLLKQPYAVKPVTAVVNVRADGAESTVRVVTPAHVAAAAGESTQSAPSAIKVAAAEPQKSAAAAAPAQTKPPAETYEVELEIANGNGVSGMAGKVGKYLEIRGFKVAKISNAHSFDHVSSKVLYSSDGKRDLNRLLNELNVIKDASNLIELKRFGNRIRIVVGKDMVALQDRLTAERKE